MKIIICLSVLMFITSFKLSAQEKYTLSGTIKDSTTGETLIGVKIRPLELSGIGAVCNEYGFYSLTLAAGTYTLSASYPTYEEFQKKVNLNENKILNINLSASVQDLLEVEVSAIKKDGNVTDAQMGVEKIDMNEINKIPVIFGEKDIVKTLQLLPGVKSAGDGNSGFFVRGGAADQNLILLDEAPVYNASHLLGFFSTFNSDVIKTATLYKGTQPAQYGGRLASVLDIKMNEGNSKRLGMSGGIGLIASRLTVEAPIIKDKGSFLIAGRRTYADLFLKLSKDQNLRDTKLFFYDLNTKLNYKFGEKDRVFLSGYFGRDVLGLADFGISWGNATGTARWNHIVNSKLFSNTSFIVSNYQYDISIASDDVEINIGSTLQDYNLKQEFQYFPNSRNKWTFGLNAIYHGVVPGEVTGSENSGVNNEKQPSKLGMENALYVSNEWSISEKFNILYGLRGTSFSVLGNGENSFRFNEAGEIKDTTVYSQNEFTKTYVNVEPRIFMSYIYSKTASIKGGYARNVQNLHLISNTVSTSPTDVWLPTTINVKPEISDQVSLGWFKNFKQNKYEFSSEMYYKWMQNQIDYRNGANTQANDLLEGELLYGVGRAYGIEFLLKKKTGKFTGWVGYTLSRTEKKIDQINSNEWYLARQDRLHDLSVVGIYDFNKKWTASAAFVYSTGNAVTFPTGKYTIDEEVVFVYSSRNGDRMPDYHRLDLALTYNIAKHKRFESSWSLSIYNAYARRNAYLIEFEENPNDANKTQVVQTTLFRIVPTVTYNFKF
ncbi:MAG: TonB-dependent receptor [Crocinitomicaceae bacterium]|nr:TonB-dependent receptor [Crocinitomicaceae bacterium]